MLGCFRARMAVLLTILLSLLYNLPRFWEIELYSQEECVTDIASFSSNLTCSLITDVVKTSLRENHRYISVSHFFSSIFFIISVEGLYDVVVPHLHVHSTLHLPGCF